VSRSPLSAACGRTPQQTLEIIGSRGAIRVPVAFVSGEDDAGFYVVADGKERFEPAEGVNIYTVQADNFARAVFGEAPPPFPPEDAVKNMRVLEAALRSARERRRIEL